MASGDARRTCEDCEVMGGTTRDEVLEEDGPDDLDESEWSERAEGVVGVLGVSCETWL